MITGKDYGAIKQDQEAASKSKQLRSTSLSGSLMSYLRDIFGDDTQPGQIDKINARIDMTQRATDAQIEERT